MKIWPLICFIGSYFLINPGAAFAHEQDTLIRYWNQFKTHDTAYINLSNKIADQLNYSGSFDSALIFTDSAIEVCKRQTYNAGLAMTYLIKGKIYISKSNFGRGLDNIHLADSLFKLLSNTAGITECLLQTGIIYYYQKSYTEAISYFSQADSAYAKENDLWHASTARYMQGRSELELNNFSGSEELLNQAWQMKKNSEDTKGQNECEWALADLYLKTRQLDKARQYYTECLNYFKSDGNKQGSAMVYFGIGQVYLSLNKKDSAEKYFLLSVTEGRCINFIEVIIKSAQALASLYVSMSDFEKAFTYQFLFYSSTDSLYNRETKQKIADMENDIKLEKKDVEIELGKRKISNDKIFFYLLLSIIGLLTMLSIVVFQRVQFKQRTNNILEKKNNDLAAALRELKAAQIQLVQNEKMASLGQLTAGIAHEINNPVNFVTSSVSPLKRNFDELKKLFESYDLLLGKTDQKNAIDQLKKEFDLQQNLAESGSLLSGIAEGSRRTAEIVKNLRHFSRMDNEEMMSVNINDGINSTLPLLQNKLSQQNIEVIQSLGNIPPIEGFPGQLNQVFMNLLSNAIDAIGNNGKIFITTSSENKKIKISIRDTGKGMTSELKQKIFDPFFTTKEVGKGTGLGLSISYSIIEKHQGKIEVKSEVGKGTEFIIWLPA
ncbi:MAG: ATP-binding protein [Chitinophagales bacterium]